MHPKLKPCQNSFGHNFSLSYTIVLKFCTEHGIDNAVLCTKCQNKWTDDNGVMDEGDFCEI